MVRHTSLSLLVAGLAVACSVTEEDAAQSENAIETPVLITKTDHPIYTTGVGLLRGYSPMFEQATELRCVAPTNGAMDVEVGNVADRLDYVLVTSRQDLAKQLGVDLDLKIKYGVGSFNPTFNLIDSFNEEARSVFVLVTAANTYKVSRHSSLDLDMSEDGKAFSSSPSSFLSKCGSHYVDNITYGARVLIGLRFDVDTQAKVNDVKAGLGLSVGFGPVGIDVDKLGANVKNTITKTGAKVGLAVASQGFEMNGGDATSDAVKAVLGGTFDEKTVDGLKGLRAAMDASVKGDRCRDTAGGSDGCSGPGYLKNNLRHASPLTVTARPYHPLRSAPEGGFWLDAKNALEDTDRTLKVVAPLAAKISDAHRREIKPFLDASADDRARFGIAGSGKAAYDVQVMVDKATMFDGLLRPTGSIAKPIDKLVSNCFNGAVVGVFDKCPSDPESLPEVVAAQKALDQYNAESRVLALQYVPIGPMTKQAATDACGKMGMRLPTRLEVERMAAAVRRATDLPSGGDLPRTVWHAGPSPNCTAFFNPPESEAGKTMSLDRCVAGANASMTKQPAFCVPSSGPFSGR